MSFSSSNPSTQSSTKYTTKTQNLNLQNIDGGGVVLAGNKGIKNLTFTDNGAVANALSTVEATNSQAFQFAQQLQGNVTAAQKQAILSQQNSTSAALGFAKSAFDTAAASQRSDTANTMTTLIKWGAGAAVVVVVGMAALRKH